MTNSPIVRHGLAVALYLFAFAATAAEPPPKPAKPAAAAKPAPAPLMTRAELRDCLAQKDRNQAEADALKLEQDKLVAEQIELQRQSDAQKAQLATLDRTDAEAVARYNEQITARSAAVDALLVRSTAFNTRVEAAQATRTSYASACTSRRYDERDEAAIRSGK